MCHKWHEQLQYAADCKGGGASSTPDVRAGNKWGREYRAESRALYPSGSIGQSSGLGRERRLKQHSGRAWGNACSALL